jgi:hypothetical protein
MADTRSRDPAPPKAARRTAGPEGTKPAFAFEERSSGEDIPSLLRRLVDQGTHLAEKQAELVRAEVRESVEDVKMAAGAFAGAAVLGFAGLVVLLMGLSFLLGEVMNLGLATLIVAAVALAGAFALYMGAQSKLRSSSMSAERTRRTLGRAPDAITGHEERRND